MNKIYRVVWNAETGQWVVASEMAKGRKKSSSSQKAVTSVLVGLTGFAALAGAPAAFAANGGALATCAEDNTGKAYGTGGEAALNNCSSASYDWGIFSDAKPDGSNSGATQQTVITGNKDGTMTLSAVNGIDIKSDLRMNNKKITGIAAGSVAAGSTDAITGDQLFKLQNEGTKYFHANSTAADSQATDAGSVAIGGGAKSAGTNTVAIGEGAQTTYNDNMAIGAGASGGGGASIAIGTKASTAAVNGANNQTAVGYAAKSDVNMGTALGGRANAKADSSVALGSDAVADRASGIGGSTKGAVSVGSGGAGVATETRQIISVARGTQDTDAVNLSQLKGVTTALGGGAGVNADGTVKAPTYTIQGTTANDVGTALTKLDTATTKNAGDITTLNTTVNNITNGGGIKYFHTNSTAADSSASGSESIAVGGGAKAVGAASIALGNNAQNVTGSNNSIAIGGDSKSSDKSVAIGNGADASTATYATAMGISSKVTGTAGTALGENTLASGTYGVALGSHATASASESVALGHNSVADRANSVSVGKSGGERQIINLAKGTADTDAVNVSQLKGVTTAMGGGAAVNTDGTIKAPTYDVNGTNYNNAGSAIDALDTRIDGVTANPLKFSDTAGTTVSRKLGETLKISGVGTTAGTFSGNNIKTVADATTGEIKIQIADAPKFGNITVNDSGKISGVAAGTAATDTDQRINDVWQDLGDEINQVNRQANRGIAAASALVNVTPYLPGKTAVNAGVASYRGEAALGVGVSRWSDNGRVNFNAGVSAAKGDEPVFRVGVGYVF